MPIVGPSWHSEMLEEEGISFPLSIYQMSNIHIVTAVSFFSPNFVLRFFCGGMWTIFKVFMEFVNNIASVLCFVSLAMRHVRS